MTNKSLICNWYFERFALFVLIRTMLYQTLLAGCRKVTIKTFISTLYAVVPQVVIPYGEMSSASACLVLVEAQFR